MDITLGNPTPLTVEELPKLFRNQFPSDKDFEVYQYAMTQIAAGKDLDFYLDKRNTSLVPMAGGNTARINYNSTQHEQNQGDMDL